MGSYVEDFDQFETHETVRTFVKIPLKVKWLVIYHEFKVGDNVLVIPNSRSGVVMEVADNKWEIKVKYDDDENKEEVDNDADDEDFDGPEEPEEQEPAAEDDEAYNMGLSIELDENGYAKLNQSQVQKKEEVSDLYNGDEIIGVNRKKLSFDL